VGGSRRKATMTFGVSLLLTQVSLVSSIRGWDKTKTIGKLKDCIAVLEGFDPPAHSEVAAEKAKADQGEPISQADAAWLKALDIKLKAPEPPTST